MTKNMEQNLLYQEIIAANKDRIYRMCCCYVKDAEDRKDVYQEILISIWKSLGTFRGDSAVGTWIYRIVVNTCLCHLRTEQRRQQRMDPAAGASIEDIPDPACTDETDTQTDIRRLYECISRLPELDRTLVSLYLEDLSSGEIAEVVGIREGNVRVKLHRIKNALKSLMEENTNEPR